MTFEYLQLDVCDDDSVARVVQAVIERAGRIDALLNVAGIGQAGALEEHSVEEARAMLETNTLGTFRMCRAVLPHMRRQGSGRIINVTSLGGLVAMPFASLYCASKFAVEGMTEALRMEVRRFGIAVSLLEPGDFLTPMTEAYPRTAASNESETYRVELDRAIVIMERDCRACPDLRMVALRVESILNSRRPGLRYTVGLPVQRIAVALRSFVPQSWFEALVRAIYQLG